MGDKWTLLIVRDLVAGPRRFVELQRVLPGISTEQLRSRLNRMVADGLLTRQRYREVPPRVDYELTPRAQELAPVIAELARWGYAWAWGSPRPGEAIDIGAIFRAIPGLCRAPAGTAGVVELIVDERIYAMTVSEDVTVLSEERLSTDADADADADATIRGTRDEWIAALQPDHDARGLQVAGDAGLAEVVLSALAPSVERVRAQAA